MCAISGCVVLHGRRPDPVALADVCHRALLCGAVRGSDSFGMTVIDRNGTCRTWKGSSAPSADDIRAIVTADVAAVLATSRATPTTEWRLDQTLADAQPFTGGHWVVSHNGTVANDHELRAALGATPDSTVDSAVLPHLFDIDGFAPGLDRIAGSFAVAGVDRRQPGVLHLARNFKPLSLCRDGDLNTVFFASNPDQLVAPPPDATLDLTSPAVIEPPPYHRLVVRAEGAVELHPLEAETPSRRALVIASGGLDSTVAAALTAQTMPVTLLHFRYGCQAERREVDAVHAVAQSLGSEVRVLPLDWLRDIGGSTLTTGGEITTSEVGAELPHEWVPARNMVMIAAACAVADADGYTDIVTGTNLEEGGSYPDNTQEFMGTMDAASQLGTMRRARITAPLGNLVKHEIVRHGLEAGAPLERTWSCYRDGDQHCGVCGPCFMRRVAFEMTGVADPVPYERPLTRVRPV